MIIKAHRCGHEIRIPAWDTRPRPAFCPACEKLPQWECAARMEGSNEKTERLRVPGGWLYRTMVKGAAGDRVYASRPALCFVPDPPEVLPPFEPVPDGSACNS